MTNSNLSLRSIDIPQVYRFGVGIDRMFDRLDDVLRQSAQSNGNYPPYNMIRHSDDRYSIEIAVAGFKQGEVNIEVSENQLTVEGKQSDIVADDREYIHRGISGRNFVRVFTLADYVEVVGARQENGILTIELERIVPENKKPKSIAISYVG